MSVLSRLAAPSRLELARAQGLFNLVGGLWPFLSLRSFEWVYGRKHDIYLQKTVGGLLASIGLVQLMAEDEDKAMEVVRRLGIATAVTFLAIDLIYIPKGEMRKTYLQDALCEIGWILAWRRKFDD